MEVKKRNFLENLRLKARGKKLGKKALAKQDRRLAHRRSISVPDLRFVPGEAFTDSALGSALPDSSPFGVSPGVSDTDSVSSGMIPEGPIFMDKLSESAPERHKVFRDHPAPAFNRSSAPAETFVLYEEYNDMLNVSSGNKVESDHSEKRAKENASQFPFDPVPAPRSIFSNAHGLPPRPDRVEKESISGDDASAERVLSSSLAAALARVSSLGDQANPYLEKRMVTFEQKRPASEKGTPPTTRGKAPAERLSLMLDTGGTALESTDCVSLDSGTPNEERVSMPWTTDSEELERESCTPLFMKQLSLDETLLEDGQSEEALEEIEVSFLRRICDHKLIFLFHDNKSKRLENF